MHIECCGSFLDCLKFALSDVKLLFSARFPLLQLNDFFGKSIFRLQITELFFEPAAFLIQSKTVLSQAFFIIVKKLYVIACLPVFFSMTLLLLSFDLSSSSLFFEHLSFLIFPHCAK